MRLIKSFSTLIALVAVFLIGATCGNAQDLVLADSTLLINSDTTFDNVTILDGDIIRDRSIRDNRRCIDPSRERSNCGHTR